MRIGILGSLEVLAAHVLVAENPLRVRLRGQVMRALHATGRQAEALSEFEDTRRMLAAELGATHLAILRAEQVPRRVGLRRSSPASSVATLSWHGCANCGRTGS